MMFQFDQSRVRNRLLSAFSPTGFDAVRPLLSSRPLALGDGVATAHLPIEQIYFPDNGFVSLVNADHRNMEVGLVGREGAVGAWALLGRLSTPLGAMCQHTAQGWSVPVQDFLAVADAHPDVNRLMLRYVHTFMMQLASTAASNSSNSVEQRLARWLLMSHDRVDGDEVLLTHDFIAMMLGVRRPGVTVATHVLEGHRFIKAMRGRIIILDRDGLSAYADGSYGVAEAEYESTMAVG